MNSRNKPGLARYRMVSGFAPVLIIVIIGLVGIISYLVIKQSDLQPIPITSPSPTSDSTTNWRTHRDVELGFSLKYPPDWKIQENATKFTDPTNSLIITIHSFDPNLVGIDYCSANSQDTQSCESIVTIEGRYAFIYWGENRAGPYMIYFGSKDGSKGISINMTTNPDIPAGLKLTPEAQKVFRAIVSTFKLLDTTDISVSNKSLCESNGGRWEEKYSECLNMDEDKCQEIGGQVACATISGDQGYARLCIPACKFN